jgi:hypothetical protein
MGADQDAVQGTVVFGVTVVSALLNGAGDALVGVVVHVFSSFAVDAKLLCAVLEKSFPRLQFCKKRDKIF